MKEFSPSWLNLIGPDQKAEVQEFLTSAGIDLKQCAGFVYSGTSGPMSCFFAKMYKLNDKGEAQWDQEKDMAVMDDEAMFWVRDIEIPEVLRKAIQSPA